MGMICSKCFKTKSTHVKQSINENIIPNQKVTNLELNLKNANPEQEIIVQENLKNQNKIKDRQPINKKNEEKKEHQIQINEELEKNASLENKTRSNSKNKNNLDEYFSKEELENYCKLYETEAFDFKDSKKIIKFQKGELIGEGSFGKVYQGFDTESGQIIAIKEIDLRMMNNKNLDKIKSFEQEINILSKLQNKNIIKYFGTSRTKEYLNIFLEYCIGGSIAKMLEVYGKFNENLIRKYTKQILEGLEYLHAHNVIHRDIKGANILVDKSGICKLSDFGGAKKMAEEIEVNKQNSLKGTPHWMAPETIKNLETTRFSDIWSLGCTVIEMATGQPPWSEFGNPLTALYNIMNATTPPELPSFLSENLKDFIRNCLKINPSLRMNVHNLLKHPFITGDMTNFNIKHEFNSTKQIQHYNSELYEKVSENKNNVALLKKSESNNKQNIDAEIRQEEIYISGLSDKNKADKKRHKSQREKNTNFNSNI